MFKLIELLSPGQVAELRGIAAAAAFVDGRITNPHSTVKRNTQLHDPAAYQRSADIMLKALQGHEDFRNFAFPRTIAPPMLTRYGPGMRYGLHPDAALLGLPQGTIRSDLSCTVFLGDPGSYEGGALHVRLGGASVRFREAAGVAVIYPSHTLHEVEPVTRGERLVGISFIQSRIADTRHRELLYELNEVAALEGLAMAPENFTRMQGVQTGLLRMWTDAP